MNYTKAGYLFLLFLLLLKSPGLTVFQRSDSLVNELNKAIAQSTVYENGKLNRKEAIKDILNKSTSSEPAFLQKELSIKQPCMRMRKMQTGKTIRRHLPFTNLLLMIQPY